MGGECNLNCTHCHSKVQKYEFNPDVIEFIRQGGFRRITFSGGEPLMYWDTIKRVAESLGKEFQYKFVSNLTLLTEEMVPFLNEYNFIVVCSFDGSDGTRDQFPRPRYDLFRLVKHQGFAITVYDENNDIEKIEAELRQIADRNRLHPVNSISPNYIHITDNVHNCSSTMGTAKKYVLQMARMIEPEIIAFKSIKHEDPLMDLLMLYKAATKWWIPKTYDGIHCFNDRVVSLSIDGRFMVCPYTPEYYGDIYTGIDYKKFDGHIPEKCKLCPIFDICKCACVENVTSQECYIARTMHRWLDKTINKWGVAEKLKEAIRVRLENQLNR